MAKKRKPTQKQVKLVKGMVEGKTVAQSARDAGYSITKPENAGQAGYQALKQMGTSMQEIFDQVGISLVEVIDKDLRSVLEAKETKFFPWRKKVGRKIVLVIEERQVVNLGTRAVGCDIVFKLLGSYAPKKLDFDPDSSAPVKVINIGGVVRYND